MQIREIVGYCVYSCVSVNPPVHHHRDPLPGSERSHILQFLVSDPYWNQKLLWVAGAQPEDRGQETFIGGLSAVYNIALYSQHTRRRLGDLCQQGQSDNAERENNPKMK